MVGSDHEWDWYKGYKPIASSFDPLKAAREELSGLGEVARVLTQRERECEEAMGRAETELNDTRKIIGYVRISMDTIRQRIDELEKASA